MNRARKMTEGATVTKPTSVLKTSPFCHEKHGGVSLDTEVKGGASAWRADLQPMPLVPRWASPWEKSRHRVMKRAGCHSDRKVISRGDQSQTWQLLVCQPLSHCHPSSSPLPDLVISCVTMGGLLDGQSEKSIHSFN